MGQHFNSEYKIRAVRRVLDSGRGIVEVASELGLNSNTL